MPRPQFTLRALLAAMLVVGAFLGGFILGAKSEAMRREHDTVMAISLEMDAAGVMKERLEEQFVPKHSWLQYLPDCGCE
ncbi:MAG TPA: hypothetical protein VG826_16450 [Pirellulales bacterium]|nr:hypothetical protein [Pirellulales bacterium]